MRLILFGVAGSVGAGVLRECLRDPEVQAVLAVGRSSCGLAHAKLTELVRPDLFALEPIGGYDACLFCGEEDLALSVARTATVPRFCYTGGQDSGDALLALDLDVYVFRPGYVHPARGVRSRTWYRMVYVAAAPVQPLIRRLFPARVTTEEALGRAMIRVAAYGWDTRVLDARAVNAAADLVP
ncbi:epimerase [Nonomuraea longicatena]|uniref:Epimerase n=1 Tax=Nonomuraea longicatena TaxID=83682 RepID=A0ABN1NN72_9ACTN